jgi:hypothetical protein
MTVIDKLNDINDVIRDLFDFVRENEATKEDFTEYLSTMSALNASPAQMEKLFITYVFERNLGEPAKSVVELFAENKKTKNKEVAKSFLTAQYSVFRIEKILKNGFELFNMTNEKQYTVLSLTKMTSFRGVSAGEFIVARIFKFRDEYFLIGIDNMLPANKIKDAIRYAIVKIVQAPWLVYQDNEDKEAEIKKDIEEMSEKFKKLYGSDIFITTNKYADLVIETLNDEKAIEKIDLEEAQKPLKSYKFFPIKELNNTYDNFIENSLGGFSAHSETYDVGIIYDSELGLYSIPFYQTFCNIFEGKEVENAKDCIVYFLKNDAISDKILKRVSDKYPDFMDKINEILESDYTFETLISAYKPDFLKHKIYSSTSVLYHSAIFSTSVDMAEETEAHKKESTTSVTSQKVGRNDPCPCGSGKKYKKCCGR